MAFVLPSSHYAFSSTSPILSFRLTKEHHRLCGSKFNSLKYSRPSPKLKRIASGGRWSNSKLLVSRLHSQIFSLDEMRNLEKRVPILKQKLKDLHRQLMMEEVPSEGEVVSSLLMVQNAVLQLEACLKTSLPGIRELRDAIKNTSGPHFHPLVTADLISPDGPMGRLMDALATGVSALIQSAEDNFDLGDFSPEEFLDARRALQQFTSAKRSAGVESRNWYWRCVSWDALRSHRLYCHLSLDGTFPIRTLEDLERVRQDGSTFKAAIQKIPLTASTVWKVLGFGEVGALKHVSISLPREYTGHKHVLAGWRALLGGTEEFNEFTDKFSLYHTPNAMISYLDAMQNWFNDKSKLPWAPVMAVSEIGLKVRYHEGIGLIGCSPVGMVRERLQNDFWGWAPRVSGAVIVRTENVYRVKNGIAEFKIRRARIKLDVLSYIEAQMTMLVCGEHVEWVDVVCHGILGGTRTFRVSRDEVFLDIVQVFIADFRKKYVLDPKPPPPQFHLQNEDLFKYIVDRTIIGCTTSQITLEVDALLDELRISRYRRLTPSKYLIANERPFTYPFGE